jgi:hypothetical protein
VFDKDVKVPLHEAELVGTSSSNSIPYSIPNTIAKLSANLDPCNYNESGMGQGEDVVGECNVNDRGQDNGIVGFETAVKDLLLPFFRCQLVDHFTIMFQLNKIKWPQHRRD